MRLDATMQLNRTSPFEGPCTSSDSMEMIFSNISIFSRFRPSKTNPRVPAPQQPSSPILHKNFAESPRPPVLTSLPKPKVIATPGIEQLANYRGDAILAEIKEVASRENSNNDIELIQNILEKYVYKMRRMVIENLEIAPKSQNILQEWNTKLEEKYQAERPSF